jgi:tetratricopeptide (TPR) repeat protein
MASLNELLDRGERDAARALAQQSLAQKPGDGASLAALARLALEQGDVDEARAHLARVGPKDRALYEVQLAEAMVLQLSDQRDAARLAFAQLTASFPGRPEAFFALGLSLLEKEDGPGAEKALATAVQLAPQHFVYRFRHAEALAQEGRFADAASELMKSIELRPDFVSAYLAFARMLEATGQPERAFEILEAGLGAMPAERRLLAEFARMKLAAGDVEAALRQAEKTEGGGLGLAEQLMHSNAHDAAIEVCTQLERRGQASAKLTLVRALALENSGRVTEALEAYATAMQQDPKDWTTANNRGLLLLETCGDDEAKLAEAKANLEEAIARSNETVPDPLLNLALWYGRTERWAEGIATAQRVVNHPAAGALKAHAEKMVASMQQAAKGA